MTSCANPKCWVVMPVLAHPVYTRAAISDVLAQTTACRLLLINQGVETAFRRELETVAEDSDRVFLWSHEPRLPSLAATWNRALDCCWECGAAGALVVNNDVRLAPNTIELLWGELTRADALLVTGVGVSPKQFQPGQLALAADLGDGHGGPDFSCFLIHRETHDRYPFDEQFVPAYCEDLDLHRRMMLDGEGGRIYAINVPFAHHGSATLKTIDPKLRGRIEQQVQQGARAYYAKKWGGSENQETFTRPFDAASAAPDVTTPQLQRRTSGQIDRPAEVG